MTILLMGILIISMFLISFASAKYKPNQPGNSGKKSEMDSSISIDPNIPETLETMSIMDSISYDPNLPQTTITISVVDGSISYFVATLSNVPNGFDVTNGIYLGWCIDSGITMTRNQEFNVRLYSSIDPPTGLIPDVAPFEWDKVNYILNHKPSTATKDDIQQAIWNYVNLNGLETPTLQVAQEIIDDAQANGAGFVPETGDVVALICYPDGYDNQNEPPFAQMTIIELRIGGGKVTGGGQIPIDDGKASFGLNAMWFSRDPAPKGELEYVDHVTGDKVHAHILNFLTVYTYNPGNKPWELRYAYFEGPCTFNHESGYYFKCLVEDDKEPGKLDAFLLKVYEKGNPTPIIDVKDTLLHGNIQIHKPPK